MDLIRRAAQMREIAREARSKGKKIGFVPTMGALHDGHLSLVRRAREVADLVVVSVFVNPKQFGPGEDLNRYPRDLARDHDLCLQEQVDVLFAPEIEDLYPSGYRTYVEVEGLSNVLEGAARPGHFRGVCTVVTKLFNIVRPHFAFLGQKDAQQALVVRRMTRDLNSDVELIVCPTLRHADGLAMSSRNLYLSAEERSAATVLARALEQARAEIEERGETDPRKVEQTMRAVLDSEPLARIDYLAVVDAATLEPRPTIEGEVLIPIAVFIGNIRLIDNILASPSGASARG